MKIELGAVCRKCLEVVYPSNPICACTNIQVKYIKESYSGENVIVFVDDLDTIEIVYTYLSEDEQKLVKFLPMTRPELGKAVYIQN